MRSDTAALRLLKIASSGNSLFEPPEQAPELALAIRDPGIFVKAYGLNVAKMFQKGVNLMETLSDFSRGQVFC